MKAHTGVHTLAEIRTRESNVDCNCRQNNERLLLIKFWHTIIRIYPEHCFNSFVYEKLDSEFELKTHSVARNGLITQSCGLWET